MNPNAIVQKLWNYCNILRDDGLSYQDYIEQLTFLLFLKMADERQKLFPGRTILIPRALDWQSLERLDGDDLDTHYRHILVELGKKPGMLGTIFRKAQNRIQDPAKLKRLISDLIGRETWTTLGVDVKGDAYEGLLEKNAADVKGGAGQYFTPRALIQAIVDVMRPEPGQLIHDPAPIQWDGDFAGRNSAFLAWLKDELEKFSEDDVQILFWRVQEFTYAEIGGWLDLKRVTARVRHCRAMKKLNAARDQLLMAQVSAEQNVPESGVAHE